MTKESVVRFLGTIEVDPAIMMQRVMDDGRRDGGLHD
jgi:hypothetical protein